ncbi:voltage-dependent T-type calcium channel subunit alpha [Acrasis kona]|uniref:Voltage-dependent T-type calcium channel subunit alpha n=1 Tax=Acrasis kona TaxID=1008807 RepID=A0AAW2YYA0_9EUKA
MLENNKVTFTDTESQVVNPTCGERMKGTWMYKALRKYYRSSFYFTLGIFSTIVALVLSATSKMSNEKQDTKACNALLILFWMVVVCQYVEATIRIIVTRSYGAIFDGLILYVDLGCNIYVLVTYIMSGGVSLSKALGIFNTTRLLFFIADIGLLRNMFRNLSKGASTIFLVFVYFATWVYIFAIITYFVYNPYFFQNATNCPSCAEYFGSLEGSFLTVFQVMTLDSWASDMLRNLMVQAACPSTITWIIFSLYVCLSAYIFVGIVTSIILQIILDADSSQADNNSGTLLIIFNQTFGWATVLYQDVRFALAKKYSFKQFVRRFTSRLMTPRDKSYKADTDKISVLYDKIEQMEVRMEKMMKLLEVVANVDSSKHENQVKEVNDQNSDFDVTIVK